METNENLDSAVSVFIMVQRIILKFVQYHRYSHSLDGLCLLRIKVLFFVHKKDSELNFVWSIQLEHKN